MRKLGMLMILMVAVALLLSVQFLGKTFSRISSVGRESENSSNPIERYKNRKPKPPSSTPRITNSSIIPNNTTVTLAESGPRLLQDSFSSQPELLTVLKPPDISVWPGLTLMLWHRSRGSSAGKMFRDGMTMIDARATILAASLEKYRAFRPEHVRRYACYAAADGANSFANLTSTRFLYQVDPASYNTEMLPAVRSSTSGVTPIPGARRKYKIAYLLMVDGDESLITKHSIEELVSQRDTALGDNAPGNVFMAKKTYDGMWGHISLVWMQLNGYWELMELADWEYVINLSSREVYRVLNQTTATTSRMMRPHLARLDRSAGDFSIQHQWMILPRTFVTYLRHSKEATMALSYLEFSWVPEQSFFFAVNTPYFASRTLTTNKRYLKYDGDSLHPGLPRLHLPTDLVKWALDEHIRRHILLPVRNGRMVNAVHPPVVKVAEGEAVAAFGGDGDVQEEARRGREVYPGYGALGGEKWVVRSGSDF
ncbi:hypothetical protein BC829DRAFT_403666, partial [Chytridium lagenaria]